MKTTGLLFGAVILSGCASIPLPPDATSVALVAVSSSAVEVYRPRFRMKNGVLKLEAYGMREFKGETTTESHIDIVYRDASGRQLARERPDVTPPHAAANDAGHATARVFAHPGPSASRHGEDRSARR
jgi:hypothetical protein